MKKGSDATQTLRAGCCKADPQTNKQTHKHTLRSLARSGGIESYCVRTTMKLMMTHQLKICVIQRLWIYGIMALYKFKYYYYYYLVKTSDAELHLSKLHFVFSKWWHLDVQ